MANDEQLLTLYNLIGKASNRSQKEKYSEALALAEEADTLMRIINGVELIDWRNLFEVKLAALLGLGKTAEVLALCRQLEEEFGHTKSWHRSSQAYAMREVLRRAYSIQAQDAFEKATTLTALERAIAWIEHCFSHVPRNERNEAKPYYELKALIYRKAAQYHVKEYEPRYLSVLIELASNKIPVTDTGIKADMEHPGFIACVKGNELNTLVNTPLKETCKQAEKRWIKAYKKLTDMGEYAAPFAANAPFTEEAMAAAEALYFIPDSLKKWYRGAGNGFGNAFNGWGFYFYRINEFKPLLDRLLKDWRDLPQPTGQDVAQWYVNQLNRFTVAETDFINEHYRVFGCYWFSEEWPCYLFYGKNCKYGALIFNQDEWKLNHLGDTDFFLLRYDTVDELLSRLVTVVINSRILKADGWSIYNEEANTLLDKAGHQQQ